MKNKSRGKVAGFALFKHAIFQTACLLGLLCGGVPAIGQNAADSRAKIPDIRNRAFVKPYAHPNQSNFSVSTGVGLGAYAGDICRLTDRHLQHNYLNPGLSAGLSYRLTNYAAVRWDNNYQSLRVQSQPGTWGGLAFRAGVLTSMVAVQVNASSKTNLEHEQHGWDPYFFAGGGILFYQTAVSVDPAAYERFSQLLVQPRSSKAAVFPVGAGVTWHQSGQWGVSLEAMYVFTTTDLLDGASLSIDPKPRKDDFLLLQLRVTHQFFRLFRYKAYLKRK
jgi:hypothetical protein